MHVERLLQSKAERALSDPRQRWGREEGVGIERRYPGREAGRVDASVLETDSITGDIHHTSSSQSSCDEATMRQGVPRARALSLRLVRAQLPRSSNTPPVRTHGGAPRMSW
eukprot:scaffold7412_cov123-Isochrysis_galbana.AAC.3